MTLRRFRRSPNAAACVPNSSYINYEKVCTHPARFHECFGSGRVKFSILFVTQTNEPKKLDSALLTHRNETVRNSS